MTKKAVIVSKEEAFWIEIKASTEKDIERLEKLIKFQTALKQLCESKILEINSKIIIK